MYKVLLVDDEPFILEGLSEIINWEDYNMEIAGKALDGLAAIEIIENNVIHILVTDIRMPKMDGLKLIKYIKDHDLNIKCIVLSGFSDFEYVREAAKLGIENYILKPVDEKEFVPTLLNTIEKIESEQSKKIEIEEGTGILRENILFRLVTGDISEEELHQRASLLNLNLSSTSWLVAVVKILGSSIENSPLKKSARRHVSYSVNNICTIMAEEKNAGTALYDLNGDILFLFTNPEITSDISLLRNFLEQCIENIRTILKLEVFIATGSIEKDFRNIYKSYSNAKKLQDYRLVSGSKKYILFEEMNLSDSNRRTVFKYDLKLKRLNKAIREENHSAACRVIDELFKGLSGIMSIRPESIQEITIDALLNIINSFKAISINPVNLTGNLKELISKLYAFQTLDDLRNWLLEIISECFNSLKNNGENICPIVKKTIDYINQEYPTDMNLKTLAANFNVNPLYLGQLFAREIGTSFNNYLNFVRIKKAKQMLLSGKWKTHVIAVKVGYVNTNYFSTVFKKITGVSPSEFKE